MSVVGSDFRDLLALLRVPRAVHEQALDILVPRAHGAVVDKVATEGLSKVPAARTACLGPRGSSNHFCMLALHRQYHAPRV